MTFAGAIHIDLHHQAGKACAVRISSSRPQALSRALLGKTPKQLLDIIPLLFTLCCNAQAYTALLACRSALGLKAEPIADHARYGLVQLETLREQAWRILLDWPGFIGLMPDKKALAALLKFDALFKRRLFRHGEAFKLDSHLDADRGQLRGLIDELETLIDISIFNGRLADFRQLTTEAQLHGWLAQNHGLPAKLLGHIHGNGWGAVGQNPIACLPDRDAEIWLQHIRQYDWAAFSRFPHWQGHCLEATLLNRQRSHPLMAELQGRYGNGLMVRLVGRLLEVAGLLSSLRRLLLTTGGEEPWPAQSAACDGMALSQIQAARGLLIHCLVLRQERVYDYGIIAPTEWNFHPEGTVAQGLRQLDADNGDTLRLQAELLINAVDPCVRYTLNLMDEGHP